MLSILPSLPKHFPFSILRFQLSFFYKIMLAPLILTLKIDDASFEFFDQLRRKYFPPERNFLSAHLTLFHHLPGAELGKVRFDLTQICAAQTLFPLEFPAWRFLGKGVAVKVAANELLGLHRQLAKIWNDWLSAQDQQKFQPHITVQNKVAPEEAKNLYEKLSRDWQSRDGHAEGLQLWHYLGAKWKLEEEFLFAEMGSK
jgi:2'-5' RNA ligase